MMVVMMILHKCSEEGRLDRCCKLRSEYVVSTQEPISNVAGMAAVLTRLKRKDTPPPPYENPPSYNVGLKVEIELTKKDMKPDLPNLSA